ncbi:TldD/PmbA family protein [Rhodococcus rhodochrous]|uniref:TldD/PmbA family protein n=1 Tax=Rhodococcus rhodochrous TaxID=1829 RepID=UPI00132ECB0C|nr:TldD/PmbA family protein [Rhodococcus rhodochrous]QHG83398.1 TldD/PmbA family protein [Rhodococcus rhodochrous]QOH56923.1 peptidase C69 [Rhodococcus rhodochrous]
MNAVDDDFLALPLHAAADAGLTVARAAGASHADVRVHRIRTGTSTLRDGALQAAVDDSDCGVAVRVLLDGTWGFASHPVPGPDGAADAAARAVAVARTLRALNRDPVQWADEPVHRDAVWVSPYEIDPFTVPAAERLAVLEDRSRRLQDADGVDHVAANLTLVKEQTFYADLAGSTITQQRVRIHSDLDATRVDREAGTFESMRTLAPPTGRGWEYVASDRWWDWSRELAELPEQLAEKAQAPSVTPGRTDLVIDPTNLWLTIHESVGHATEYDRAIGYEAAYAGTSFATPDLLGSLRYGSDAMHVTADRTEPHGMATVGYDDDGVAAQSWDLVKDGVLVGYQLDRAFAPKLGVARSNGCAYADSAHHVPIQRMANVSLQPDPVVDRSTAELIAGVDDGLYIVGDRSWSIDMQRHNFQFTGQRFYRIRGGRLAGQVRDVAYQASTTEFWGALEAVGGASTWQLGGAMNCGKAQPGQVASVSHGCPSVLVRGVNVLNTVQEGGR